MDISPGLSYSGALQIMGRYDHPAVHALDKFAGGLILGSALRPHDLLDLIDPKNEAAGLLQQAVSAVTAKLHRTAGYHRGELITAAHAVIVTSAFFEALRERLGAKLYARLKLTKADRRALVTAESAEARNAERLIEAMTKACIPLPSAIAGWTENAEGPVRDFYGRLGERTLRFLEGLEAWGNAEKELAAEAEKERKMKALELGIRYSETPAAARRSDRILIETVVEAALLKYEDMCRRFAVDVPEFRNWLDFREHAATRSAVRAVGDQISAETSHALQRLEHSFLTAMQEAPTKRLRGILADLNAEAMDRPIVATDDTLRHIDDVTFPAVRDGYITPSFRMTRASVSAQPSRDEWWQRQEQREDLEDFLRRYLQDSASWRLPLVVLGHPGAGKSLLLTVLAARLPATAFATVRVELRGVPAAAPLYEQISHLLRHNTHGRMAWEDLAQESKDVVRVVLLDGLDELIQATGVTQSTYLHEVAEFQRRELAIRSPVIVIVTSRIIVADRTTVPDGATVIKLEDFDQGRVAQWLEVWRSTNQRLIDIGIFRPLTLASAMRHGELVRQPLLLLMLALYVADQNVIDDNVVVSQAMLYQRLLENFVRREVSKSDDRPGLKRRIDDDAVEEHLWRLGLAAFAMFNRGRQHVSEAELGHDFETIEGGRRRPPRPSRSLDTPISDAMRTIGRFFFVHAAEAEKHTDQARRTYEFLHATFGEYLIAATTAMLLIDASRNRAISHHAPYQVEVQEPLLASLLSHHPFLKRVSILHFAKQLFERRSAESNAEVAVVLEDLCRRSGHVDLGEYNPSDGTAVARTAAYTANLVALRAILSAPVQISRLAPEDTYPQEWWRITVRTWYAALDPESWDVMRTLFRTKAVAGVNSVEQLLMVWPGGRAVPAPEEALEDLQGAVMADRENALKYAVGDLITRYIPMSHIDAVPAGLDAILELSLRPSPARRRELYALMLTQRIETRAATNPLLLACLARDASLIDPVGIVRFFEALMSARWTEPPDLMALASVMIASNPAIQQEGGIRRQRRLAEFGTHAEWTRAFASAALQQPVAWPEDNDELFDRIGESTVQAANWADLIHPPAVSPFEPATPEAPSAAMQTTIEQDG
ncbi:NACHT domain-containing protein [Actinoplanes philippinensis]|uniref:NACHT domain-containing protein n=1 Tax=Actinoplanes philippinensis TaxID=35752 RepID=UPI0033C32FCD